MRAALCILVLAAAVCGHAEILDRVAVAVENSVITESEILRQIRLTALLNREKPNFTPENKRKTAERLIEQMLIRREISMTRYLLSGNAGISELYNSFRKTFKGDAAYRAALAEYKIADDEVKDAFRWQATLLDFIDIRFRPGVQIADEDLRDYYKSRVASTAGAPSFEDARARIETALTGERVNAALDRWLGQARTQIRIRYKQEAFR